MRVLVTGHRGYIGAVLTPMLVEHGHDVIGVDVGFFDGCDFDDPSRHTLDERRTDVRDLTSADLDGVGAVIHLAALSNDPLGDLNPLLTATVNHEATVVLADAAKRAGVERFVFASSCSLYGAGGDGLLDETAPMAPVTPYGWSKVEAERSLVTLADDDFSPVFLRNATAYGASPRLRLDVVVNNLTAWAVTTGQVRILSDGSPWRPLVHVDDISAAAIAALTAPRDGIHAQAVNVGRNQENYQIREVAEIVGSVVPDSIVTFADGGEPDTRDYRVDFSKALDVLPGFAPTWTVRTGAEDLYRKFLASGFDADDFGSDRYFRLRRIGTHVSQGLLDEHLRWVQA